jgi:hypothetical protein
MMGARVANGTAVTVVTSVDKTHGKYEDATTVQMEHGRHANPDQQKKVRGFQAIVTPESIFKNFRVLKVTRACSAPRPPPLTVL